MKKKEAKVKIRIPHLIYKQMMQDLQRPHPFAYERVGFLTSKFKQLKSGVGILLFTEYHTLEDRYYIRDRKVGARINADAIHNELQRILTTDAGCFHVHLHGGTGRPYFSRTDITELPPLAKCFVNMNPDEAHGMFVLSNTSFNGSIWIPGQKKPVVPHQVSIIGYPMKFSFSESLLNFSGNGRYERQSFLGENTQHLFKNVRVGIVGYGGGGSHIGQQLAHLGFHNITVFDDQRIEETNLNRLVGASAQDVKNHAFKANIAKRVIKGILPKANVTAIIGRWQDYSEYVQECDFIIGGVDSFSERKQLEAECRRYFIPLIDIGMDVHTHETEPPNVAGQIVLSLPGGPCMSCLEFLTEENLGKEAGRYGNAGSHPQVVWSNGILASEAVGILVEIICGWTRNKKDVEYLSYRGNSGVVDKHLQLEFLKSTPCPHYPIEIAGKAKFMPL